jgi:phosphoglycolate phosphatase
MVIFWDVDGTLLTTARAGIHAWEDALREVSGVGASLQGFDTAGHPDHGIAHRLLVEFGGQAHPDERQVAELVRRYEDLLPASLHRRAGHVLPNVRAVLERLAGEPGICSLLLTGNTRRGAEAKLAHYGLLGFFRDGAFSERVAARSTIAQAALERAGAAGCTVRLPQVYVIGDTPHDIQCGSAIGARTLAVATGRHTMDELRAHAPWRVLQQLPDPEEFLLMLAHRKVPADA